MEALCAEDFSSSTDEEEEHKDSMQCNKQNMRFFTPAKLTQQKIAQYGGIVRRKIEVLKENPFAEVAAKKMEDNGKIVICIMANAAQDYKDDITRHWISEQFKLFQMRREQCESLEYCCEYLMQLALSSALEAQAKLDSNLLRERQLRRLRRQALRVDEKDKGNKPYLSRSLEEEVDKEKSEEEDNDDPYFRRNDISDIQDIFSQPAPSLAEHKFEEEEDEKSSTDGSPQKELAKIKSILKNTSVYRQWQTSPTQKEAVEEEVVPSRRKQIMQEISKYLKEQQPPPPEPPVEAVHRNVAKIQKKRRCLNEKLPSLKDQQKLSPLKKRIRDDSNSSNNNIRIRPNKQQYRESDSWDALLGDETDEPDYSCLHRVKSRVDISQQNLQMRMRSIASSSSIEIISAKNAPQLSQTKKKLRSCLRRQVKALSRILKNVHFNIAKEGRRSLEEKSYTIFGQTTTIFTTTQQLSEISTNLPDDVDPSLLKSVPNSDKRIRLFLRTNPLVDKPTHEILKLKREISSEFAQLLQCSLGCTRGRMYSRLFIVDSMLSSLNSSVFKNTCFLKMIYPRMPEWFLDALDSWFNDFNLTVEKGGVFCFDKVFILLGMDLILYYAHPEGHSETIVFKFYENLREWFIKAIAKAEADIRLFGLKSHYMLHYRKGVETPEGFVDTMRYRFPRGMPAFVLITIPEIGDWKEYFKQFNSDLRQFVLEKENSQYFELFDWAQMVEECGMEDEESISTVEKRTAMLMQELNSDHGVLYE